MGLFTPKYPDGAAPERKPSRRERAAQPPAADHMDLACDALNRAIKAGVRGDTATEEREKETARWHRRAAKQQG